MERPAPLVESFAADASVAERARRRITWRLMPFLLLLYFFAYIDRTNVSIAKLTMKDDLGFTETIIGTGAGIFFIGYFLLEIPGSLIVERWSARKWIARIMISWGIVATIMGFMGMGPLNAFSHTQQFYWLRFLLGIMEAGFFPGIIVYLSHWFRYEDRAKAKSLFMIGIPIATIIGTPLSRFILEKITWYGLAGWRWVFILEGIPSVILGFVTLYVLTDRPHEAKWLPEDEKRWITTELEREKREKESDGSSAFAAFKNPKVILLAIIYLFVVTGYYGLLFFLPSVVELMQGMSIVTRTMVTMLPYICGLIAILLNGQHSDRSCERRWHTALPILFGGLALGLSVMAGNNLVVVITLLCLAGIGLHAYLPVFWTIPTSFLSASTAATAIGLINSVGNLGGHFGPQVVGILKDKTGSFAAGMYFLAGSVLISGVLAMFVKVPKKKPTTASITAA